MRYFIIMLVLIPSMAWGQSASPTEQALSAKLSSELGLGLQCNAALISMQQELSKSRERIKTLEEKYESKKPEGK